MDIKVKVQESIFDDICTGERKILRHGFSRNKKYQRLFVNEIDSIIIIAGTSLRECIKQFESINITVENEKKIIKITLK